MDHRRSIWKDKIWSPGLSSLRLVLFSLPHPPIPPYHNPSLKEYASTHISYRVRLHSQHHPHLYRFLGSSVGKQLDFAIRLQHFVPLKLNVIRSLKKRKKKKKSQLSTLLTFGFAKYKNIYAAHTININTSKNPLQGLWVNLTLFSSQLQNEDRAYLISYLKET